MDERDKPSKRDKRDYLNPDIIESMTQPAAIAWEVDPSGRFAQRALALGIDKSAMNQRLIAAAGYLPGWIRNSTRESCQVQLTRAYGFGPLQDCSEWWTLDLVSGNLVGRELSDSGTVEELFPIMMLHFCLGLPQYEVVRIYQHAMVSIFSKAKGVFITRMD